MEKPKKTISPDYIQGKLRQGWVMQDFCEDLGVSESFLLSFIDKHSGNKIYGTFHREIKQNEHLAEKKRREEEKKANAETSNATTNTFTTTTKNEANTALPKENNSIPADKEVIKEEIDPVTAQINSLNEKIKLKEAELATKNALKTQILSEIENLNLKIVRLQSNIERLEKELELAKQSLSKSYTRTKVITSHIISLDSDISTIEKAINDYKSQIMELQKINIMVFENGEIELDKKIDIPDSWNSIYSELLSDSIVENITVKQVQQLAKMIALSEILQKEGAYFEFIFEKEPTNGKDSVKTLFELLTEKST